MGGPSKRRWGDLSPHQRRTVIGGGALQLGLLALALGDLARRRPDQVHGPKPLWFGVSLINFVGPLAYFAWGRKR
jgi:hypothetical protein